MAQAFPDLDRLTDAAFLELLLARTVGSGASETAERLLHRFGDLHRTLGADPAALASIAQAATILDLKLVQDLARRLALADLQDRDVISSSSALLNYLRATMAWRDREQTRVIFLDHGNKLIADEVMGQGTVNHSPVYPREVVRRALELAASRIVIVHNHPSGDATPSAADIDVTHRVVEAAQALGLQVLDHFIVAREAVVSFQALGLMPRIRPSIDHSGFASWSEPTATVEIPAPASRKPPLHLRRAYALVARHNPLRGEARGSGHRDAGRSGKSRSSPSRASHADRGPRRPPGADAPHGSRIRRAGPRIGKVVQGARLMRFVPRETSRANLIAILTVSASSILAIIMAVGLA